MRQAIEEARNAIQEGCVLHDIPQLLTNAQKTQARTNIGVGTTDSVGVVRFDEDQVNTITEAQAAMVRRALRIPEELTQRVYHVRQIVIHRDDHFVHLTKKTVSRRQQVTQNTTFFLGRRQTATE